MPTANELQEKLLADIPEMAIESDYRERRAEVARARAREFEGQNPDDKILVHVGSSKPAEKIRGIRI